MRTALEIEVGDLSKEDIFANSSEGDLLRWRGGLQDIIDNIQTQIEAYRAAETGDEDWVRRAAGKVAVTKRALRWVDRRCQELNIAVPLPFGHRLVTEIRQLQAQVADENKGETRRIMRYLAETFPGSPDVIEAIKGIGAGEHRKLDVAA